DAGRLLGRVRGPYPVEGIDAPATGTGRTDEASGVAARDRAASPGGRTEVRGRARRQDRRGGDGRAGGNAAAPARPGEALGAPARPLAETQRILRHRRGPPRDRTERRRLLPEPPYRRDA